MKGKLEVEIGEIEWAHRPGAKPPGSMRLIIVKFISITSKNEILRIAYSLKDVIFQRVSITDDFTPNVRLVRSKLWDYVSRYIAQSGLRFCSTTCMWTMKWTPMTMLTVVCNCSASIKPLLMRIIFDTPPVCVLLKVMPHLHFFYWEFFWYYF